MQQQQQQQAQQQQQQQQQAQQQQAQQNDVEEELPAAIQKSLDMAIWTMMTPPLLPLLLPWLTMTMSRHQRTVPIPMKQLVTSLANGGIPGFVHDNLQFATILSRR